MLDLAWCGMESAVFRYLNLLKYVHKINLSPDKTLALLQRLETDSCRPKDYEVLIRIIEAHIELSADVLAILPERELSSPMPKAKVNRSPPKRTRRHHRH
jgi:hypothetical protein